MSRTRARRWPWVVAALVALLVGGWFAARTPDIPIATLRVRYASPASRFVEVLPGLVVHLRDEGPRDAPVLMLVHGSNASLHTWQPWVDRLHDRTRIVRFDLPGHGLSGPDPSGDYRTPRQAQIVGAVADKLGLQRFALGGNSMGGGVAARFAAAHSERVAALILVDASGAPFRDRGDTPLAIRIANLPVLRDIAASITPRAMVADGLDGAVSVKSVMTPAVINRYWELLRYPGNRAATLARFAQGYNSLTPADTAHLTMPALILWGREDRFIPVASAAWFARALPQARTVIYDGIGHLPMEETPDRSASDVRALLAQISAPPRVAAR